MPPVPRDPPKPTNRYAGRLRRCNDCELMKPYAEYYCDDRGRPRRDICIECWRLRSAKNREKHKALKNPPAAEKCCERCQTIKPSSAFWTHGSVKDGLHAWCKACENSARKGKEPVPIGHKYCPNCEKVKPLVEFYTNKRRHDGYDQKCIQCAATTHQRTYIRHKYGLTPQEHAQILESQNGVCAICGKAEATIHLGKELRLSVDHDHASGRTRGLLCYRCNHFVGYVERYGAAGLKKVLEYLKQYGNAINLTE